MLGQAVVGVGNELLGRHLIKTEMLVHKSCEVEARLGAAGTVILEDGFGMLQGRAVNEGFAVRKDALHLHRDEQLLIALGGG